MFSSKNQNKSKLWNGDLEYLEDPIYPPYSNWNQLKRLSISINDRSN